MIINPHTIVAVIYDLLFTVLFAVSDEDDTLLPQQQEHDSGRSTSCDITKIRNNIGFW